MKTQNNSRRDFIKKSATIAGGIGLAANMSFATTPKKAQNKLPQWKGFNLLDFFSPKPNNARGGTKEEYFKWMSDWGFDFVRIPMAYPSYLKIDHEKNITIKQVRKISRKQTDKVEHLVYLAHKYNLHASLNLHRAP
ncbi:MAG: cellulase family glycosylhydrolase, partial [Cyclobacteriaceae bacterium]|nr:cellulase family glycosylhydrolase [Cyclobacteriaceae bacterium]